MDDRQLLEAAAKAAGIKVGWRKSANCFCYSDSPYEVAWNPLADDGDALRLAHALRMNIEPMNTLVGREKVGWNVWPSGRGDCSATTDGDSLDELRRAITRAAAALGERGKTP